MIAVSNAWKVVQNQTLLPEMFVEIDYTITEPGLQDEAVASGNYPESFSDEGQITNLTRGDSEAYSTLDYGCWGLDGRFSYFDGTPHNPGYVDKNYSQSDCLVAVSPYPKITISFDTRHEVSIPGIVIAWSETFGCWATDFRITVRNAGGIVSQKTVTGNKDIVSVVDMDISDYSNITVEIIRWSHPYQRIRCSEIHLGVINTYTKADLIGYDHNQAADLLSAALPENSVTFKLRNDDGRWNPANPSGFEQYLMEQQKIHVRYGMDVNGTTEWIEGGTFWLSEWSTPSNGLEAVFTARDAVVFMNPIYLGIRSGTLYNIAVAALIEADIPTLDDGSVRYVVDESLKNYTTDFSAEDTEYTISEVLQMVAHAGGCVFYQDRYGVVRIEPWVERYSDYMIGQEVSYAHPEYSISKPLKSVSVGYGDKQREEIQVGSKGEIQTVDNEFIITREDALRVGNVAKNILKNRKVITGEFRADMRMDVLDCVIVGSKYSSNVIGVTEVSYSTTGGAFRGKYTGRVVSVDLEGEKIYSGEIYVGEVLQ